MNATNPIAPLKKKEDCKDKQIPRNQKPQKNKKWKKKIEGMKNPKPPTAARDSKANRQLELAFEGLVLNC